jgi:3-isopropylmalate/(R)-2-methylmalate dehydratase large subunit
MSSQARGTRGPGLVDVLGRVLGHLPAPGTPIEPAIDRLVLGGAAGPEAARIANERDIRAWDSSRVALTFDFPAPHVEARVPRSRSVCRDFAARLELKDVFDLNQGVGAQVLLEKGVVAPGEVVAGCGRCLHLLGAAGALVFGTEPGVLARTLGTGRLELKMPRLLRIVFDGAAKGDLSPFDLGLLAARALQKQSADTIVEFTGRAVSALSMDGRITLVEVGAAGMRSGFVPADGVTAAFLADRRESTGVVPAPARKEAPAELVVSLAGTGPMIQGPGPGGPCRPLADLAGKKIHSAFLGSCAAGRLPDLMAAAAVVKRARRIHPDVRLSLAPATLEVARGAVTAGLYEIFINAGAMVSVPGSSPGMAGGGAVFGEGEVILSTVPYQSAMTDAGRGPEIYRASPAVVAAGAVLGRIPEPTDL